MAFNIADYPEAFEQPFRVSPLSAWLGHLPLAAILVKLLKPRVLVELGTHGGDSYLAFCNAVRRQSLPTQCTAVDTWQGDAHTGPYGPEILRELKAIHDPNFGTFSRLLQSSFDNAAGSFADGSTDLLHIDGMHTYDAVKHDYQTWLPKVSSRGVVLFHDTAERQGDFGVWRLWEEISQAKPSANLLHGHGLGILCVGPEAPPAFLEFLLELNSNPGLAKILAALGDHATLLNTFANAMKYEFQCQLFINEWRQRTGQPISNPTTDFAAAIGNPDRFGQGLVLDTRQLVQDALNIAAELMRLRGQGT
jgi:hypothetical protein